MKRILPLFILAFSICICSCSTESENENNKNIDTSATLNPADSSGDFTNLEKRMEEIVAKDSLSKE